MDKMNTDFILPKDAKTLHGLFQIRCQRSPNDLAYKYFSADSNDWISYTWSEASKEVKKWRKAIRNFGLKKSDAVGLMLKNCPEWIFLEQACLAEKLTTVPLYPNDRADNVAYICNETQIQLLLIENHVQLDTVNAASNEIDKMPLVVTLVQTKNKNENINVKSVKEFIDEGSEFELTSDRNHEDSSSLASIVYTSGTTGRPKGVMLSHWNILSNAYSGIRAVTVYPSDLFLSFLPLSHTLERTVGYYIPVMTGASVAFSRSIPQLPEDLVIVKPTILVSVPRIYERVYTKIQQQLDSKSPIAKKLFQLTEEIGWERFEIEQGLKKSGIRQLFWPVLHKLVASKLLEKLGGNLRLSISGGAPLAPKISHLFISFGLPVLQGYGLTETSPIISVNRLKNNDPVSIGQALPDVEVRIEDSELQSKSDSVMLGYWNNPDATKEVFTDDGWIKTGDLARIDGDNIYLTGRLKEILVLSNGEKISPVDMEIAISLHPLFEQAMVIGEQKPYITAIIVLNPENWKSFCNKHQLDYNDKKSLTDSNIKHLVLEKICTCLNEFPGYAQIRQITLTIEPWTDENSLLTPSLKIRRKILHSHFESEINDMYAGH